MISNDSILPMWGIEEMRFLWGKCCLDLGIDPRLVKPHFLEIHELPYWSDPTYCQAGEAWWEKGHRPEVMIDLLDYNNKRVGAMMLRDTIYHELVHVILQDDAGEQEVEHISLIIARRRSGWSHLRRYLKSRSYRRGLGPLQEGLNLFQWAKRSRAVSQLDREGKG